MRVDRIRRFALGAAVAAVVGLLSAIPPSAQAIDGGAPATDMAPSVARILVWGAHGCTGSVVGDGWVLTAYHCYPYGERIPARYQDWHQALEVVIWRGAAGRSEAYRSRLSEPPRVRPGSRQAGWSDVALWHLATPMPAWVKSIPMAASWPAVGTTLTQYGYGTNAAGALPPELRKTPQGDLRRVDCPAAYRYSGALCTQGTRSAAWFGDSGGPLLWWEHGWWQQVGVFSVFPRTSKVHWNGYWSTVDGGTRQWIFETVGASAARVGDLLRDSAGGAAWQLGADGYRHWVPDGATFQCLVAAGAPVLNWPLRQIEALPDRVGVHGWASCTGVQGVRVWPEQQGSHGVNTFRNPANASGPGERIGAWQWVEVSCKVYAPQVVSVNPDGYWYRVASWPWSGHFFAPANTFWNGDVPGQTPYTHNTDWSVPDC